MKLKYSIFSCQLEIRTGFFVSSKLYLSLIGQFYWLQTFCGLCSTIGEWFWHSDSDCARHQTCVSAEPNQLWFRFGCFQYTNTYLLLTIYITGFTTPRVIQPSRTFRTGLVQSIYSLNFGEKWTFIRAGPIKGRGRFLQYFIWTSRRIHLSNFTSTTATATTAKSNFCINDNQTPYEHSLIVVECRIVAKPRVHLCPIHYYLGVYKSYICYTHHWLYSLNERLNLGIYWIHVIDCDVPGKSSC